MATEGKGYRVTPKRAAELQSQIDTLADRLDRLAAEVRALARQRDVGLALVRARVSSDLQILRDAGGEQ